MGQLASLNRLLHLCRLLAVVSVIPAPLPAPAAEATVVTSFLPPFTDPDDPVRPGFYVEVAKAAFAKAGLPFAIEFQPWSRAQANTLAKPGLFILGLAHTPERDKKYKFAAEILASNICFLTAKPAGPVDSLDQARGLKSVAVRSGTNFETILRDAGFTNIDSSQTDEQAARKLIGGHVQAWLTYDVGAISTWRKIAADQSSLVVGATVQVDAVYLAAAKETPDALIQKVHDAVQAIHADGTYDRIYEQYLGPRP